jgi:hypothetical protein
VSETQVRWLLLNHRKDGWAFSIAELPEALGCGRLVDLAADAPFEVARDALTALVRQGYGVDVPADAWKPVEDDDEAWGADLTQSE